jgi:class 3 adenylate cyclase
MRFDGRKNPLACSSCNTVNSVWARFCNQCGARLGHPCVQCSHINDNSAKNCSNCLGPLASRDLTASHAFSASALGSDPRNYFVNLENQGERKVVTALFADIKGSVKLLANLDPEIAQGVVEPVLRLMGEATRLHEGYVVHTTGDGIFALFGAPISCLDHPLRAIHAALELQKSLLIYSAALVKDGRSSIQCRVGINTGEVVVREVDTGGTLEYLPIGHPINLASRLQSIAPPGSIVIGGLTRKLVDGYFRLQPMDTVFVKGISDPIDAYLLNGVGDLDRRIQLSIRRGLSSLWDAILRCSI